MINLIIIITLSYIVYTIAYKFFITGSHDYQLSDGWTIHDHEFENEILAQRTIEGPNGMKVKLALDVNVHHPVSYLLVENLGCSLGSCQVGMKTNSYEFYSVINLYANTKEKMELNTDSLIECLKPSKQLHFVVGEKSSKLSLNGFKKALAYFKGHFENFSQSNKNNELTKTTL
ncbi:hypothetical protein [Aureibacter tunicatorum]|uniref:Uncharacterized protein n=1 Tax=Aureibacter tunicatorum TaxID=866807 RepID=A0AAE4BRN9_9BACT|nr:hypothetical protein [Aureibacter tunicatorum]MDR6238045.1 hypothetical protein [Aureibacter tunicatorum]